MKASSNHHKALATHTNMKTTENSLDGRGSLPHVYDLHSCCSNVAALNSNHWEQQAVSHLQAHRLQAMPGTHICADSHLKEILL